MAGMPTRTAHCLSIFQQTCTVFFLSLLFGADNFVSARGIAPAPSSHRTYSSHITTTTTISPLIISSTPLPPDRYIPGAEEAVLLRQHLLQGLGMTRVPDVSKMNISQEEYDRMFAVYLDRVEGSRRRRYNSSSWTESDVEEEDNDEPNWDANNPSSHIFSWNASRISSTAAWPMFWAQFRLHPHLPNFLINLEGWVLRSAQLSVPSHWRSSPITMSVQVNASTWIDKVLSLPADLLPSGETGWTMASEGKELLLDIPDLFQTWIAVQQQSKSSTLGPLNFGLRSENQELIQPPGDETAVVQVKLEYERRGSRVKRSRKSLDKALQSKKGRTDCNKQHRGNYNDVTGKSSKNSNKSNCCRHSMKVAFRDLQGFEFILKPDYFDAFLCKGRCPSRFNPAHDHALLQSLLHAKNNKTAPRPCCAPSKLEGLEILHADENDHSKLTVTKWDNVIVTECACA